MDGCVGGGDLEILRIMNSTEHGIRSCSERRDCHVCLHSKCMLQGDDDGEMTSEIERKFEITAEKAHEVLRRMSDEDCEALGFNIRFSRPDWMILTVLPVPPPPVRPSVMMDSSARYATRRAWGMTRPVRS